MTATKIRVLLTDDQSLFREGLRTLLSIWDDIEIVGEAANGQEALDQTAALAPHVVLMDLRMPVLDGVAATRLLTAQHPDTKVIVLTTFDDDEDIFNGLKAGAIGYLLKDVSSDKLVEAIRVAASGGSFLQPSVAAKVVAEFTRMNTSGASDAPSSEPEQAGLVEPLSKRELEILRILATGASNKEIANKLFLAEGTVKNHISNVLGKLGVRDRTQAALKAAELNLL